MKQLEIEYKTLLSTQEFARLTQKFAETPLFSQTNYYFDTPEMSLRKAKLALRIRTLNDRAELTLKIPQDVGNLEHNLDLSLAEALDITEHQKLPLNEVTQIIADQGFDLKHIKNIGQLTTHRRESLLPIGLLAIDENHYAGKIDYEVELEVSSAEKGQEDFNNFLRQEQITFKYAKSKVARFVETLAVK